MTVENLQNRNDTRPARRSTETRLRAQRREGELSAWLVLSQ
jgi:hypothetical protein